MIITISGYDGVGKSTNVKKLIENICKAYNLSGITIFDVNNGSEVYEDISDLDVIYDKLSKYDVIGTRFYMRSKRMQALQESVMFTDKEVFKNKKLIKEVTLEAKKEADIWFEKVISKLIKKNKIVIYDRYWYDEVAYRSLYGLSKLYVKKLYENYYEPQVKLFLYGDMNLIKLRNKNRIDQQTALFCSKDKMKELFQNMEEIKVEYSMNIIDVCNKDIESVKEEIFNVVLNLIKEKDAIKLLKEKL